ncbi:hypothetical protein CEXT_408411 [Caerostris extrusa]|uniref:Uncharacterized protein n=1 Tax=Caerostris extrusa TaxID=172846 RepID=A0AAV4SBI4_CAEEX|nr:hypothetical protein CEXT_408411 [Caerostris extrusa]
MAYVRAVCVAMSSKMHSLFKICFYLRSKWQKRAERVTFPDRKIYVAVHQHKVQHSNKASECHCHSDWHPSSALMALSLGNRLRLTHGGRKHSAKRASAHGKGQEKNAVKSLR